MDRMVADLCSCLHAQTISPATRDGITCPDVANVTCSRGGRRRTPAAGWYGVSAHAREPDVKSTSWVAAIALVLMIGFVVYSSLTVGGVRCEVCIAFDGRSACRAVDGDNDRDAMAAARTNTCAQLASGVTQTMACERTPPARAECKPH